MNYLGYCLISVQFAVNQEALEFQVLRDTQGMHVPFRLQMERKLASRVSKSCRLQAYLVSKKLKHNFVCVIILNTLGAEVAATEKLKSTVGCTDW